MKKIELKLNIDQLNTINIIVSNFIHETQDIDQDGLTKMLCSIVIELSEKLAKKAITERVNKKTFKFSLRFYEAFVLEGLFRTQLEDVSDHIYEHNVILTMANQINNYDWKNIYHHI